MAPDEILDDAPQDPLSPIEREWLLLNGVRQMMSVAQRTQVGYADAVGMTLDLAPTLLSGESIFVDAFESNLERLYRARAAAQSSSKVAPVSPIAIIEQEIEVLANECLTAPDHRGNDIDRHLNRLHRARARLAGGKWTESQAIRGDSGTFGMGHVLPVSGQGKDYRDYKFHEHRLLRVRILHPDPAEWKTGVDLIYESYWDLPRKPRKAKSQLLVRVAALQYKMWNGKNLYLSSDPRLRKQIERAKKAFCDTGLCNRGGLARRRYGLPHCSAFLRPTNLHQTVSGFALTRGWHVPACEAARELDHYSNAPRLESKRISSSSVSQTVFAELFNKNMLGSRWVQAKQLEKIYRKTGVLEFGDRVVIHAQEYGK